MKIFIVSIFILSSISVNAQDWDNVDDGVGINGNNPGSIELFSFDNKLFVGGFFTSAGGNPATGVAYWDDLRWLNFTNDSITFKSIRSFVIYKDELYGFANYSDPDKLAELVKFDINKQSWVSLPNSEIVRTTSTGNLYSGYISRAIEFEGELYISGSFDKVGDETIRLSFAKWNGDSWSAVLDDHGNEIYTYSITDMEIFKEALLISGKSIHFNGESHDGVIRYDGTSWNDLRISSSGTNLPHITQLETYKGALYAAGRGCKISDNDQWYWMAKWDGENWEGVEGFEQDDIQEGARITALKTYANHLVIGKTHLGNTSFYDGEMIKYAYDRLHGVINSFEVYKTELYASGFYNSSAGQGVSKLVNFTDVTPTDSNIHISPNPSNGNIVLEYKLLNNSKAIIEIFDSTGKLVFTESFNDLAGNYVRHFDLQGLPTGIYFLKILTKGFTETKSFVKI